MAYRFKLDEPLQRGVRRIAGAQIGRVVAQLQVGGSDQLTTVAVHDMRKSLKRCRSLLRLVRSGLEPTQFARENARLRDLARLLAGNRDHAVQRAGIDWLATVTTDRRCTDALQQILDESVSVASVVPLPEAQKLARQLQKSLRAIAIEGALPPVIEAGLATCLRRCVEGCRDAYAAADDEAFHDWRKTVQWHWRHMQLLSPAWPGFCAARSQAAQRIANWIGEDHDLAGLTGLLQLADANGQLTRPSLREASGAIAARQAELRAASRSEADRLLADQPDEFARRLTRYWAAAAAMPTHAQPASDA
jgi:CHAD domain-containing protein